MTDPETTELRARRILEMAEDAITQNIIEATPALAAEARHLAEVIRESVAFERGKSAPGNLRQPTRWQLETWAKSSARFYNSPTFWEWCEQNPDPHIRGQVRLELNKDKKDSTSPDFEGKGHFGGHRIKVAAWISENDTLRLGLIQESEG